MKNLDEIKKELREVLVQGIPEAIKLLKSILPSNSSRHQDVLLLEGRLNDVNVSVLRGIISNEDLQLAYNQLRHALLELINSLEEGDLEEAAATGGTTQAKARTGSILYRIPDAMQLDMEHKCIVRIAVQEAMLVENLELDKEVQIQQVRISDVMMVQLLDAAQEPHFQIRAVNSTEQFLDEDTFTEWLFYVKPLFAGSFALLLKVSVVEQILGKERCREIVLEERVEVITETPAETPSASMKTAAVQLAFNGIATDDTRIYARNEVPEMAPPPKKKSPLSIALRTLALVGVVLIAGWLIFQPGKNYLNVDFTEESEGDIYKSLPDKPGSSPGAPLDSFQNLEPEPEKPANGSPRDADIEMILVRGGTFTMGCNEKRDGTPEANSLPLRKIRIKNFFLGITEVTTSQYVDFLNEYRSTTVKEGPNEGQELLQGAPWAQMDNEGNWRVPAGMESLPAFLVTWYGAAEFARFYGMRLPSEAEWEYAARGGRTQSGSKYAGSDNPDVVAWYRGNADNRVHAVRMKMPNALGLYDMSGNLWEWTADCGHSDYTGAPLNSGAWVKDGDCGIRMLRGGSFTFPPEASRNCYRLMGKATDGQHHVGFRVVQDE